MHILPSVTCQAPGAACDQEADCVSVTGLGGPALMAAFQQLGCTFTFEDQFFRWKAWVCLPCRPSSHAHRNLGLPGPSTLTIMKMPHIPSPVIFPWLWIMQLLLKTVLRPSLKPTQCYLRSFEQLHGSLAPRFRSQCHCS